VILLMRRFLSARKSRVCSRCSHHVLPDRHHAVRLGLLGEYVGRIYQQVRAAALSGAGRARTRPCPRCRPPTQGTASPRAVVFAYHNVGDRCLRVLLARGVDVALVVTHRDNPTRTSGSAAWRPAAELNLSFTPADPPTRRCEAVRPRPMSSSRSTTATMIPADLLASPRGA
jgi:hypothetical protein